jgi:predicted site-specific integrase-resolvase
MQTQAKTTSLMPLDAWASAKFGVHAPCVGTLRRWARDGKIFPAPKKIGRSYYVSERAEYVDHRDPDYLELVRGATQAQ